MELESLYLTVVQENDFYATQKPVKLFIQINGIIFDFARTF